jgi:hypothetical protein
MLVLHVVNGGRQSALVSHSKRFAHVPLCTHTELLLGPMQHSIPLSHRASRVQQTVVPMAGGATHSP